ncbi:hypothetical protein ACFPC0_10545 [Streptomyces andamanensis]|uniref:Uncharacterized protein n=1 Tax=Streptomyces andamanensis TaxID=1565035 RepID=A0ABV8TCJ9_9ACTN
MFEFPGYTLLGTVSLTELDLNRERALSVYRAHGDGSLALLDAVGCACCRNLYSGVTVDSLERVDGPTELASYLTGELAAIDRAGDHHTQTEAEIRAIVAAATANPPHRDF